jgi:GT2 family glycosyltransferase
MDEQFPIFFNDVDLCYRLRQAGWQIYFCPDARFQHRLGASTRQVRGKMILRSVAGLRRFYDKHYRHRYPRPLYRVIIAAILLAGGARWAAFQMSARRRSGD